jgi:hypothetical protein
MGINKNVRCIPFDGIKNAYVVISGHKAETVNGVQKCMSFFYDNGNVGAKWDPDNGPITMIYSCKSEDEDAQPHWFYDFYTGEGYWSQSAVEEEGLPSAFLNGDYKYLFSVLKKWSDQ